jgi:phytoene dehydrogenase-like protein
MARIVVAGGSLPGIAAAARLARAGHDVTLVEAADHLGGRLADPGVWAPVIDFPAPLRDLFRKSGRPFDAELGRRGLQLVPAPPAVHVFADSTRLTWSTGRAEQWHLLNERFSSGIATHWRDTLDDLDETWQLLRPLGLEGELIDRAQVRSRRPRLDARRSVEDLARHVAEPHLAELVRDTARRAGSDPRKTPAWMASRLTVERTFGRWHVVDADGAVQPATVLIDALTERLSTRGVRVLTATRVVRVRPDRVRTSSGDLPADAVVSALNPWLHTRLLGVRDRPGRSGTGRTTPALAPLVTVRHDPQRGEFGEEVRHTAAGPVVTYTRPDAVGTETVVHDYTAASPAAGAGVRWRGPRTWLRILPIRTPQHPRLFVASASGRGGSEPWAQLLTGALATYAAHEQLTGEDIRPSNRAYRP